MCDVKALRQHLGARCVARCNERTSWSSTKEEPRVLRCKPDPQIRCGDAFAFFNWQRRRHQMQEGRLAAPRFAGEQRCGAAHHSKA